MELGALVCSARSPKCSACPVRSSCKSRGQYESSP
jgi:A/G-specific adenine glycosylase